MDKKNLKNLDKESIKLEINSLKRELFNLKLNSLTGQVKDVSQFNKIKVQIARALTFFNSK
ncbi:MAG: 50S ribosomal protein L29 [candidate division TM6 bacterium GW2011_GWF2_37_49]|nr:MAG: 50S ribosomal protein L29 [candidate division TM6 bacterium GW2011_GWF2_37_49]